MENQIRQFRVLTNAEMDKFKGAGPNQDYIGPPVKEGKSERARVQSFFGKLAALFTFDFSAFWDESD